MRIVGILTVSLLFGSGIAAAHGGHHHHEGDEILQKVKLASTPGYEEINREYKKSVKPIVLAKCMDCHGGSPRFPWYYAVPGVHQLLDHDVAEGKEHIDFSKDFPFGGHGTPEEDVKAMKEVAEENDMPPFLYKFGHSESRLSAAERQAISRWADFAEKILASAQH